MDKKSFVKSLLDFYDLVEPYELLPENYIVIGGGCGVVRNLWKMTTDTDLLAKSVDIFSRTVKALKEKKIFYSLRPLQDGPRCLDFECADHLFNVFEPDSAHFLLSSDYFASDKIDFDGNIVYARPLKLIENDLKNGYCRDPDTCEGRLKDIRNRNIITRLFERA